MPSFHFEVLPATQLTIFEELLCGGHVSMHWDISEQDRQA